MQRRIYVKGEYQGSNFAFYRGNGRFHTTVRPGTVLTIPDCNSGWWAKPITCARTGAQIIGIVIINKIHMRQVRKLTASGSDGEQKVQAYLQDKLGSEHCTLLRPGAGHLANRYKQKMFFDLYPEPTDLIDATIQDMGLFITTIRRVAEIKDAKVQFGGLRCTHFTQTCNGRVISRDIDGELEIVSDVKFVEKHNNVDHIGCLDAFGRGRVSGGKYLLQWSIFKRKDGIIIDKLERVWVTPSADVKHVVGLIKAGAKNGVKG